MPMPRAQDKILRRPMNLRHGEDSCHAPRCRRRERILPRVYGSGGANDEAAPSRPRGRAAPQRCARLFRRQGTSMGHRMVLPQTVVVTVHVPLAAGAPEFWWRPVPATMGKVMPAGLVTETSTSPQFAFGASLSPGFLRGPLAPPPK